jgi:hypothetical protein
MILERRQRRELKSLLALILGLATAAVATAASTPATLKWDVPAGWVSKTPSSSMRLADFTLPRTGTDKEDATFTVYFFGGQGGSVQANLDRWIGQMQQPDGRASKDAAKTTTLSSKAGLKITLVDVPGTYVAEVTPGSAERLNKPGFRQIAAVVETPGGPHFVKLVGPAGTVAKWEASTRSFLQSLRYE